ncbi:MAG: formate/nitrite transporter family protein [Rubrobacter sp.]
MAESKNAGEILEAVVEDGREELDRASLGLAFSGLAAGLNISFSAVALGVVGALTGGVGLAAILAYPVGFIIVILGRAQLFTENTVTPVTVALTDLRSIPNLLRLWVVVFVANILGTIIFAAAIVYGHLLEPAALGILFEEVAHKAEYGFGEVFLRAIFGGWLVALIAWLVAASQDTISRIIFIFLLAALIPAAGLTHCIAGSSEFLISVFSGEQPWAEYLGGFLLPTTLGNTVGGVMLVSLLNYGQVLGSKAKTGLSNVTDNRD